MPQPNIAVIILAAGKGTRMKSSLPKVLHPIGGRPMIQHIIAAADELNPSRTVVVIGKEATGIAAAIAPIPTVVQSPAQGTGHAVQVAMSGLNGFEGDILVLYGDVPMITVETLQRMVALRAAVDGPSVVVLGFRPEDPAAYGRLVLGEGSDLERIVEAKDASPAELEINLCNSGIILMAGDACRDLLAGLGNDNAQSEYYLTDVVGLARDQGLRCMAIEGDVEETIGVNSRSELADAEGIFQNRARASAMEQGATLKDPSTVYFSFDTRLGRDVVVGPNVVFGPAVIIEDSVTIEANCHLEGAHVASGAKIGPFARLRPGADIREDAKIGNFVEVKKAIVEEGAKVSHLTYIGDARVGAEANIGAGTITANYDGFNKHFTDIGEGASIGSNTVLVAPVKVGDGAMVGAGSVVSKDVPDDAIAVTRAKEKHVEGGAARFRQKHGKDK